ncbi:MAG: hypothetical protein JO210_03405 [Acidobacteriaceae bacterium]|nr:hypothetical protein [Acidobacteriaceae bacterium]
MTASNRQRGHRPAYLDSPPHAGPPPTPSADNKKTGLPKKADIDLKFRHHHPADGCPDQIVDPHGEVVTQTEYDELRASVANLNIEIQQLKVAMGIGSPAGEDQPPADELPSDDEHPVHTHPHGRHFS